MTAPAVSSSAPPESAAPPIIPFNRPSVGDAERAAVFRAMESPHHSGDGPFTRACHSLLADTLGVRHALLTTSGTHALEMMALLAALHPGDEIVVPSFTFVSTANAFALRGARIVFGDVRPDTLNLDERRLPELISPRTRAIVVVHYAGVGCDMNEILAIADARGIPVWEDNAHGLLGRYRGRYLGTFGALSAQSFHETKNFSCGEGGALLINDPAYLERAEIIREKGTNRSRFFRGMVDKYTWVDLGSSYLPSDLLAAILLAQLERREEIQARRRAIWERYAAGLSDWAAGHGVTLPHVPPECEQAYHMFYLLLPDLARRQALMAHLRRANIHAVFHYLPLHLSEVGRRHGGFTGMCPVTEDVSDRLLRLPFYTDLTTSDQNRVIDEITGIDPARLADSFR